jgi:hypothetical protein
LLGLFASLERNPLVRLEAVLGLSPSPLERLLGMRGPFSGMTEATMRLVHLDIQGSLRANVLTIPFLGAVTLAVLFWSWPRMTSRRREYEVLGLALAATAVNNAVPALLS